MLQGMFSSLLIPGASMHLLTNIVIALVFGLGVLKILDGLLFLAALWITRR